MAGGKKQNASSSSDPRHPGLPNKKPHWQFYEKNILFQNTVFTNVWPMYKVQKTPSSHPHLPSERFEPGAPCSTMLPHPPSAALGCVPDGLRGPRGSEAGSQAFSDHSRLCNCDEASSRFHLPAKWKQRSAFTPHSRFHRLAASS